jgi:hypothetical protein
MEMREARRSAEGAQWSRFGAAARPQSTYASSTGRTVTLHPFGQIPTYQEGDRALFETGSIVFHIAERHAGLLPADANARAITGMFAAAKPCCCSRALAKSQIKARASRDQEPSSGLHLQASNQKPRPRTV